MVILRGRGLEDDAMIVELGGKDCVFVAEVKDPVECVGSTHRGCLMGRPVPSWIMISSEPV